ncbi:MAG: response regulator of the LytR/AlgR family [Bacteroidetes bacterium]|nr:MAG: response regulator of the LytR/AlgR family [Bacteroidota bacterium]
MLLRCAIIDDDNVFTEIIRHYISRVDFVDLAGVFNDCREASAALDLTQVDFLFLDVEVPGMSGIEMLQSMPVAPPVVLISGKKEYGADAFDHDSIDYLHKPVLFERFQKSIHKVRRYFEQVRQKNSKTQGSLFVRQERIWVRIQVSDILYIKANDNNVVLKTAERTYKVHSALRELLAQLPESDFLQVHRSFIVQLNKIEKVDGEVIEINNRTIPVSKTYLKEMYKRLNIDR